MIIKNGFEVEQSVDKVWTFLQDIPQVAACLPGTELTEDLGDDQYRGSVIISMGPVKLEFDGEAEVTGRDEVAKTLQVDGAGKDRKGRGQAALLANVGLTSTPNAGTKVDVSLDLALSGAAAQFGRGMVSDITGVLLDDFSVNMARRLDAVDRGLDPNQIEHAAPASGFVIALRAARTALGRVFRRFFLPYRPQTS
jgi:carbon monoxide dehydrogenase subunit G